MKICNRCVMDETEPDITFDENGFCNHCTNYFEKEKKTIKPYSALQEIVEKIKTEGKNRKYNCAIGISGGLDSSYTAYLAKELGLRALLIHFDNHWNTPQGDHNVRAIADNTGWDLIVRTCDFEEIKDLQLSYLKAGVKNFEVVTDHSIKATVYNVIDEYGIKYLLTGNNLRTEGILPESWRYTHSDASNIRDIHRKHGEVPLKTFPIMSILKYAWISTKKNVKEVRALNYHDYDIAEAKKTLEKDWGWQDYGWKHCECLCTKFFQHHILPTRWGVDKRKAHLSSYICSGQMTREKALETLKSPIYPPDEYEKDRKTFLNKLGLTDDEFEKFMRIPKKRHEDYATDSSIRFILRLGRDVFK